MKAKKIDRRVQRTRRLLQDALIALVLKKGYDKLTVQDIIDQANIGRSTFYAHYLDKDDLMASCVENLRVELHQHMASEDNDAEQETMIASLGLFRHTKEQRHLYKAMIGGRGIDIVIQTLHDILTSYSRMHLEQIEQESGPLTIPIPVLTTFMAGSLQTLLTWWMDNDVPYSPEEMNEMFMRLVMHGISSATE